MRRIAPLSKPFLPIFQASATRMLKSSRLSSFRLGMVKTAI